MKSPNFSYRDHDIDRITIHCLAGQLTATEALNLSTWTDKVPERSRASCNWIVGKDGEVAELVPESLRSWCSSNRENDMRAITIEVASSKTGDYVTPDALAALDRLVADIMQRYNKTSLLWLHTRAATDAHKVQPHEMVLTVHNWYANKTCPGPVLTEHLATIAHDYPDDTQPADWATDAIAWATSHNISDGSRPKDPATREEVLTMIYRAIGKENKNDT